MKRIRPTGALLVLWLAACATTDSHITSEYREADPMRHVTRIYEPIELSDPRFRTPPLLEGDRFAWNHLLLNVSTGTFPEDNQMVFLIEVEAKNDGPRPFRWGDYDIMLGLPNMHGDWEYRLLFSRERVSVIPPGESRRLMYSARFPGASEPERYVLIFHNLLGGRDVGFPFARVER